MNDIAFLSLGSLPNLELPPCLRATHRVATCRTVEELPPRPDLILADEGFLEVHGADLVELASRAAPLHVPVALCVAPDAAGAIDRERLACLDDVLVWDPRDPYLELRLEALLRARARNTAAGEELQQLFDALDFGVCIVDLAHRITRTNASFESLLGWDRSAIGKILCGALFQTTTCREHACPVFLVCDGKHRAEAEMTARGQDGAAIQVLVSTSPYRNSRGQLNGALVSVKDLSQRKEEEEERISLLRELLTIQKDEAIGRLAGGLAHYFNNTMAVITSSVYFARAELDERHPVRQDLETIGEAAERAVAAIDQLVSVGRRQVLRLQVAPAADIVHGACERVTDALAGEVTLDTTLESDLDNVEVDIQRMTEALASVIESACEGAEEPKAVTVRARTVRPNRHERLTRAFDLPGVIVDITGFGRALEPYEIDRLFDPVFKKRAKDRTGLELAVARGVVEQSGGFVTLEAVPDTGNTYRVWLPAVSADAPRLEYPPSTLNPGSGNGKTVLVVDDEEMVRRAAMRMLRDRGYAVLEADGAEAALAVMERSGDEVDVILTDVVMPEINGRELIETLRERSGEIKAVYMSGYGDDIVTERGVLPRDVVFLRKPFNARQLYVAVWDALHLGI